MILLRRIISIFLILTLVISLMSTFYEYSTARNLYHHDLKRYEDGTYKTFYHSMEELMENRVNSNRYEYGIYKFELTIEIILITLVSSLLITNRLIRKKLNESK